MLSYIGRPEMLRGYNRETYSGLCGTPGAGANDCGAAELIGSRVMFANAEVRFPLIRQFYFAIIPFPLPPIDGLAFYDAGVAWGDASRVGGSRTTLAPPGDLFRALVHGERPAGASDNIRYPLRSYGFGIRVNLFNFALARWDYAIPLDIDRKGFWTFSLGPSF